MSTESTAIAKATPPIPIVESLPASLDSKIGNQSPMYPSTGAEELSTPDPNDSELIEANLSDSLILHSMATTMSAYQLQHEPDHLLLHPLRLALSSIHHL